MSNPSYSPSFDETGPLVPPTGDDLNARTSAAVPDPNVEPALVPDDDDTADEELIEVDEEVEDDDSLDDFDDLEDDDLDDDEDDDDDDTTDLEDLLDVGELDDELDEDELDDDELDEDDLDEDDDDLEEVEFEDAAQIERDIAADTAQLGRDDGNGDIGRSLSDTQPL